MRIQGIDVSSYQGAVDWERVKADGIKFAILRCHQRYGVDECFEANYKGCKDNGIAVGVYKYSYALTQGEARREAEDVLAVLEGKSLELPVFYDLEDERQRALGATKLGKIAYAFYRVVNEHFMTGVYCNKYWLENVLPETLRRKDLWIASYAAEDTGKAVVGLKPSGVKLWQYSQRGNVPGIDGPVDMDYLYKDYGGIFSREIYAEEEKAMAEVRKNAVTASDVLKTAGEWVGRNAIDGSHREIIDLYNSYTPRARGYAVQYTDSWCDTFVSAVFIKLGAVGLLGGTECGVEEHVKIFQAAGIWIEDGTITPQPGDIIVFNWDQRRQPNNGFSDHIGIVETAEHGIIHTIEGNASNSVARRAYNIGDGYIRGFARPRYATGQSGAPEDANKASNESGNSSANGGLNKSGLRNGTVTASALNVRRWAGTEYPNITSVPLIYRGQTITICDTVKDLRGADWYYSIVGSINGAPVYGFVSSAYIS